MDTYEIASSYFFNVDQLNEEINKLLDFYNLKKVRRFNKSRTELFELLDKPYLHPLRANRYVYKEFKKATVGIDYHVELFRKWILCTISLFR